MVGTSDKQNKRRILPAMMIAVAVLIACAAFAGMGMFMYNMGKDMATMTEAVSQMTRDVHSMAGNMNGMAADMVKMADSMVAGQDRMGEDFAQVATDMRTMTNSMVGTIREYPTRPRALSIA